MNSIDMVRNKSLPLQTRIDSLIQLMSTTHPNIDTSELRWDGKMNGNVSGLRCRRHPDTCRWNTHPPPLNNIIRLGTNCRQCAIENSIGKHVRPFVRDAIQIHPPTERTLTVEPDASGRFDYSTCDFKDMKTRVSGIRCIEHDHTFDCRPEEHLSSKHGCCEKCMLIATSGENHHGHIPPDEYKERLRRFHGGDGEWLKLTNKHGEWEYLVGGLYMYNLTGYIRLSDYIRIYCPKCDRAWEATATNHVHPGNGDGDITRARRCQTCSGSKGEKEWLDSLKNPDIIRSPQHRIPLENEEHRKSVNRTYLKVDGYDPKTNTVYEFLGCWYHGCPHKESCLPYHKPFPDDHIHTEVKKTMLTLRNEWYARKDVLEALGYNVVSIWECEFRNPK